MRFTFIKNLVEYTENNNYYIYKLYVNEKVVDYWTIYPIENQFIIYGKSFRGAKTFIGCLTDAKRRMVEMYLEYQLLIEKITYNDLHV